jgi:uroporphyrinogen decarboxylase
MSEMTKRERVAAALRGDEVDRVPLSFWGHDYIKESSPEGLAEAMLERHRRFDWDYMKLNPRSSYYPEAWGATFRPSTNPLAGPARVDYPIKKPEDWAGIEVLDLRQGPLGEHVHAAELVSRGLVGDAPFVQTVFSPLSVTRRLARDEEEVKRHMVEAPQALHQALDAFAETLASYARACLEAGADGIFFATTVWATRNRLTEEEYKEFGRPYDLRVLEAVQGADFNILHVCEDNNMLKLLLDYPVHAINWAATLPANLDLAQGMDLTDKAVMGGISEKTVLLEGSAEDVAAEARQALEQTGGRRFLLAPGCSISPAVSEAHLKAAKDAVQA